MLYSVWSIRVWKYIGRGPVCRSAIVHNALRVFAQVIKFAARQYWGNWDCFSFLWPGFFLGRPLSNAVGCFGCSSILFRPFLHYAITVCGEDIYVS